MMGWTYFKDFIGANVYFTFDKHLFSIHPQHVLVIPFLNEPFLLTKHKDRRWEFPCGKLESGGTIEEAAILETWEERGARVIGLKQIGEYYVINGFQSFRKAVVHAQVKSVGERPLGYETLDAGFFPFNMNPFRNDYSPFMKDHVFYLIRGKLQTDRTLDTFNII